MLGTKTNYGVNLRLLQLHADQARICIESRWWVQQNPQDKNKDSSLHLLRKKLTNLISLYLRLLQLQADQARITNCYEGQGGHQRECPESDRKVHLGHQMGDDGVARAPYKSQQLKEVTDVAGAPSSIPVSQGKFRIYRQLVVDHQLRSNVL